MKTLRFPTVPLLVLLLAFSTSAFSAEIEVKSRVERLPEGKVSVHLEGWKGKTRLWHRQWHDLYETELDIVSPVAVHKGQVLVVVRVELYSLDLATGKELFGDVEVGACAHAPVVAKDGTIYCTGYYGPFLTAVSPSGKKLWSYENEDMWWPMNLRILRGKIRVNYGGQGSVAIFDTTGSLLQKKERQ